MRNAFLLVLVLVLLTPPAAHASGAVDVIVALDTSGTMTPEVAAFKAAINSFAAVFQSAAVDLRLILIAASNVCIPAPLGSGACPADENLPRYRHVAQTIQSNDALSKILATYPQWSGSLRSTARKFVIVVSDADSDLSAISFDVSFRNLQSRFSDYVFHGMVVALPNSCGGIIGNQYAILIQMRGGLLSNLCTEPISAGLDRIAQAIVPLATGGPGCEVQASQSSYTNGQTIVLSQLRFFNNAATPAAAEVKLWAADEGMQAPASLSRFGADGSVVFPGDFDVTRGPYTLGTVSPSVPRGLYHFGCRTLDPVSGEERYLSIYPFTIQ